MNICRIAIKNAFLHLIRWKTDYSLHALLPPVFYAEIITQRFRGRIKTKEIMG